MESPYDEIRRAFRKGKRSGATHMLSVIDRFPWPQEDYITYVMPGEDVREKIEKYRKDMQDVIEVYNLSMDMESQISEKKPFHID